MELVWYNPSPHRTMNRPSTWELIGRDGTIREISAHQIPAMAERKRDHQEKQQFDDLQIVLPAFFCF